MGMIENMAYRRKNIMVMQLFYELKQQFPEIPDSVVFECMAKFNNDRKDCIKFLEQESRHYLHSHSFSIHNKSLYDMELHERKVLMQSNDSNLTPIMPKKIVQMPNESTIGENEGHFHYQFAKLESLRKIVINERRKFQVVESQVRHLRNVLYQRKVIRSTSLPLLEEKTRLMKEISEIRLNCHCLTHEADEILKGEVPLGETSEDFYNNIELNNNVESSLAPTSMGAIGGKPSTSALAEVEEIEGPNWPCMKCTFLNHPALDRCEECEMPNIILGVAHKLEVCQEL